MSEQASGDDEKVSLALAAAHMRNIAFIAFRRGYLDGQADASDDGESIIDPNYIQADVRAHMYTASGFEPDFVKDVLRKMTGPDSDTYGD